MWLSFVILVSLCVFFKFLNNYYKIKNAHSSLTYGTQLPVWLY